MNDRKQLAVRELRKLLEAFPDDLLVQVEGCDCYGEATSVRIFDAWIGPGDKSEKQLLIERDT